MKCRCCVSLRSAVYFGASVNIFLGVIYMGLFTYHTGMYLVRHFSKRPEQLSLTWISFFIMLFKASVLPVSCIIFRGVEKENLRYIRKPMWVYLVVKVLETTLNIIQESLVYHPSKRIPWDERLYQTIDIGMSVAYFLILFFYSRRLAKVLTESDYFKTPAVDDNTLTIKGEKLLSPAQGQAHTQMH